MKKISVYKLCMSALFLALGIILPFLTGQIPEIGSMLLPMHLPVLLCGFLCGAPWGLVVGAVTPLLRSLLFTMPPPYPTAVAMAFELAVYGWMAGFLYARLPRKTWNIYLSLIGAMAAGRIVWGAVSFFLYTLGGKAFSFEIFMAGAFVNALPGILLQLVLIPLVVLAYQRLPVSQKVGQ